MVDKSLWKEAKEKDNMSLWDSNMHMENLRCPSCRQPLAHTGGTLPPLLGDEIYECAHCEFIITIKLKENESERSKEHEENRSNTHRP